MHRIRLGVLLLSLFLYGCVTMPGGIRTNVSEFDGSNEIVMEPAWVCKESTFGDCHIKLGLYWRSTMPQDKLILVAMTDGINAFSNGKSLYFNIDGEFVSFDSIDTLTEYDISEGTYMKGFIASGTYVPGIYIPPVNWSSQRYIVDKYFMEKILKAQRVAVRLDLRRGYVEGVFSKDDPMLARPAFRDFFNKVFGNLQKDGK